MGLNENISCKLYFIRMNARMKTLARDGTGQKGKDETGREGTRRDGIAGEK